MSALLSIPIDELLRLWTELEEARLGRNGFGSDTAEIYAYRFHRRNPEIEQTTSDSRRAIREGERDRDAARALAALLDLFETHHERVQLFVDDERFVGDVRPNPHRWHIRVEVRT